jgi:hypothetical protein
VAGKNLYFFLSFVFVVYDSTLIQFFSSTSYVDGSIRFYLSGEKSIITKGRAFLTPPYFISDDDKYHEKFFTEYGGDAYQLAEETYDYFNTFP